MANILELNYNAFNTILSILIYRKYFSEFLKIVEAHSILKCTVFQNFLDEQNFLILAIGYIITKGFHDYNVNALSANFTA